MAETKKAKAAPKKAAKAPVKKLTRLEKILKAKTLDELNEAKGAMKLMPPEKKAVQERTAELASRGSKK
jgi:hypothetical protein